MAIVTITSDWGLKDACGAMIKASIMEACVDTVIIDTTHNIEPFNIIEAAFVVKRVCGAFPPKTIHLVCVSTQEVERHGIHVVMAHGHYFIAPNNGILSMVLGEDYDKGCMVRITTPNTFHELESMVPIVKRLLNGEALEEIGSVEDFSLNKITDIVPVTRESTIAGRVVYVDNYGNAITNITKELFEAERKGRRFTIFFGVYKLNRISNSYIDKDVALYDKMALFNSSNLLEIAVCQSNASTMLGLYIDVPVIVEFKDLEI